MQIEKELNQGKVGSRQSSDHIALKDATAILPHFQKYNDNHSECVTPQT